MNTILWLAGVGVTIWMAGIGLMFALFTLSSSIALLFGLASLVGSGLRFVARKLLA